MGQVFRARDSVLHCHVALKFMQPLEERSGLALTSLLKEEGRFAGLGLSYRGVDLTSTTSVTQGSGNAIEVSRTGDMAKGIFNEYSLALALFSLMQQTGGVRLQGEAKVVD
ncbi:hypothetical protein HUA74_26930 [Myxococcus sp. CA051A]|uniref:hypothetical protein n=1 Tax=Myxococcus sp. CA051A TaxID=2741739 RepID=UPI00157A8482|nr:hypothetical protein [Myxococcus sp. CA051A]NTX64294.1 hypothetical protein [Myxococcus sp. CA051A]